MVNRVYNKGLRDLAFLSLQKTETEDAEADNKLCQSGLSQQWFFGETISIFDMLPSKLLYEL